MSRMPTTPASTAPRRERRFAELFDALRLPRETTIAPDERHLAYVERRPGTYTFVRTVRVLRLGADGTDTATEIASFPGWAPRWSPDGRTIAYLLPPADALEPGEQGIELWSLEERSSRRLLDVPDIGALAWSPDGAHIAFTAVPPSERGPIDPVVVREAGFRINGSEVPAGHAQLYVIDAAGGAARQLVDLPGRSVGAFAWSPDGARIAFAAGLHFHEPSHLHLVTLDGALERLGPEEGECVSVAWTPDGRLVFAGKQVARTIGHTQLWLRDPAGGPDRRLAADLDLDIDLNADQWAGGDPLVTPDGGHVVFTCTDQARVHVFRAPLHGDGPTEKILDGDTAAYYHPSAGSTRLAVVYTDALNPGDVLLAGFDGSDPQRITDINGSLLADAGIVVAEDRWFTAPDGTRIHGLLRRPAGATGPTPLMLDCHGGPHWSWCNTFHDGDLYNHELIARGFSVLLVNPRGSTGYGEEYYRGVTEGWGEKDFDDFMCAVDALIEDGTIDPDRMAVTGYSYGGFSTNNIIGRTDRFQTAVSYAGVTEFVGMFAACAPGTGLICNELGGPPPGRWELYDQLSPLRRADRIKTPVLFLHPLDDQTAPVSQSESLFTTLKMLGNVETELVLYPGCHHLGLTWPFPSRNDAEQRLLDWTLDHLGMEDVD